MALAVFAGLGGLWLARLDYAKKISTDVLDLIPPAERAPELAMVRALASEAEARTMLFVLTMPDGTRAALEADWRFAAELRRTPAMAQAVALGDPEWREPVGRELFALRFPLLFPGWLGENETADLPRVVARRLKEFLSTPEGLAFQDLVPADPLLLLPDVYQRLKGGLAPGGAAKGAGAGAGLVWAQLAASPLSEAGQAPAFAAIDRATAAARAGFPGLQVAFTGVNRFAAASRARIEREVAWLNTLSLAAVLGVAWLFIRGVHRALHLLPVVAFSVLGAWVATTMAFERVHVIVFVLGALLTGVAIDYGFYLYMQPPARPEEDYWDKVRRLAKPLLASCLTTVTGFALLLFSELPMIRQLGVFVGAGLLCALGGAVIYFSTVRNSFLEARAFRGAAAVAPKNRQRLRWLVFGCWIATLPGLARLTWRDDIRELEVPAPEIRAEDARIRAAFENGQAGGREKTVYLTHGATLDEAREALHRLHRWLGRDATVTSLAPVVPTAGARANAARFAREHPDFPGRLRAALEAEGFEPGEFAPFFEAYASYVAQPDAAIAVAVERVRARLSGPLALLLHTSPGKTWFVTLAEGAPAGPPPAEASSVTAQQLQSLNRLFADYRSSALRLSLAGLAIVGAGVLLSYGLRDGARIFAIPAGACVGVFGLFGWLGFPLNLFHLLGAFLGVCLTHNYSIFSATSAYRSEPTPVSVRLSALTTAASFGVLALSGIPVVRALGVTVAAMVIVALAMIELEYLKSLGSRKA